MGRRSGDDDSQPRVPVRDKLCWNVYEVNEMTGLGVRTIWRLVSVGKFPKPLKTPGCRRALWAAIEVRKHMLNTPMAS